MKKQYMLALALACALMNGGMFAAQDQNAVMYEFMDRMGATGSEKEVDALVVEYANRYPNDDAFLNLVEQFAAQQKVNLAEPVGEPRVVEEAAAAPMVEPAYGADAKNQGQLLNIYNQAYAEVNAATTPQEASAVYDKYLDQLGMAPILQDSLRIALNVKSAQLQGVQPEVRRTGRRGRHHGGTGKGGYCHGGGNCRGRYGRRSEGGQGQSGDAAQQESGKRRGRWGSSEGRGGRRANQ